MVPRISRLSFILPFALLGVLLAAPATLRAGQNSWTGSRPREARTDYANLIAAVPSNPYVVFAVFEPDLYKSNDGGRTWTRVASFTWIHSLLVHPADATIYVGAALLDGALATVFRSDDSGATWTQLTMAGSTDVFVDTLAGAPSDAGTVYAGSVDGWVYQTRDAGATWTRGPNLANIISELVVHPTEPQVVYTGTDASYYYFFGEASIEKSVDGGVHWSNLNPGDFGSVTALAIDTSSRLYMNVESDAGPPTELRGLLRSDDDGSNWTQVGRGLPTDIYVSSLVTDPHAPGTLYAGTSSGVYRSRDSGENWTRVGLLLSSVFSLQLDDTGRFLQAGTDAGAYALEIIRGPIDLAARGSDTPTLFFDSDRLTIRTMDDGGDWRGTSSDDPSTTWTATAIAAGADGLTRVLWQCADGRWGIEIVGPSGRQAVHVFSITSSLAPVDVAVGADGAARVLFSNGVGVMQIASVDSSGALHAGIVYGPAPGWTAVSIADGPGGNRVLWRCTDGRGGISLHDTEGAMTGSSKWVASAGFLAEDLAVGADGHARLLRTNAGGVAEVSTLDAAGQPTAAQTFTSLGFTPRRIAAGADGTTRLLWNAADGTGQIWILNLDNTERSRIETPTGP